jgi:prepilin-type processing-associated H-X9-DG protein
MRDLLIRYLLGELDEAEQLRLEERLRNSPELRRELDYLRACFAPGSGSNSPDVGGPPRDLARRITEKVSNLSDESLNALASRPTVEPSVGSMSWSLADLSVAAGVFLAVSMLLLPALRGSRDTARLNVCADNQRILGRALASYAGDNWGLYPEVQLRDNVGVFAALLVDDGYLEAEEMQQLLLCPASDERDAHAAGKFVITIPTVEKLRMAKGAEREKLLRQMRFSYAYRLGYVENNKYHCVRKGQIRKSCEPILADAPRFDLNGLKIANHGGHGFNLLYGDGHVEFKRYFAIPGDKNLYLNLRNKPAAGRGQNDIVLGASAATPGVEIVEAAAPAPAINAE